MTFVSASTIAGCNRPDESRVQETQTTAAEKTTQTVEHVKDDPSRFYGKKITLTGEVDDIVKDPRSFKLEGNDWLFADEIRVLTRAPVKMAGASLAEDDRIVVTGTLRPFTVADIERDVGWDLSPELEIELRSRPVLIAEEVRKIESGAKWTASKPEGELSGVLVLITSDPKTIVGQRITLDAEQVRSVQGKGFWVGPSHGQQTFVMPPAGSDMSKVKEGSRIDVVGTVKKTPPANEALASWGLPASMRNVLEREPLYVEASSIKNSSTNKDAREEKSKKK